MKVNKKIIIQAILFIGVFVVTFCIVFNYLRPGTISKVFDKMFYVAPPANPRYPSESKEDWSVFDNTTRAEMDDNECLLTYQDGSVKVAKRVTNSQMRILNNNLDNAEIGWINLHIGTCLITYRFEYKGKLYTYYQHLVDTDHVFVSIEPIDSGTENSADMNESEVNQNG